MKLMKLMIMAFAITGITNGAVNSAEHDNVMLHCAGFEDFPDKKIQRSATKNILMAKDGSWMVWNDERLRRENKSSLFWLYKHKTAVITFLPKSMDIIFDGDPNLFKGMSCFPITNPFS